MGIALGDVDGDLDLDLFVSHLTDETNTLYLNLGPQTGFADRTAGSGLGATSSPYTGFGTSLFDYDNDGDLDLAVVNGSVKRRSQALTSSGGFWSAYAEPNLLYENLGDGRFVDRSATVGGDFATHVEVSRGLLPADIDGDGDLDLLVTNVDGPARVFRNEGGNARAALDLRLLDPENGAAAAGASVLVETDRRVLLRASTASGSYLSSGDGRVHVGLDGDVAQRFEVIWPGGSREEFAAEGQSGRVILRRGGGSIRPSRAGAR